MLHSRICYGLGAFLCLFSPCPPLRRLRHPAHLSFQLPDSIATYPFSMNDSISATGYWVRNSGVGHVLRKAFSY
jgi:hypothetical protein